MFPEPIAPRMIGDLRPGESTWTTPWAVEMDADGRYWLNLCWTSCYATPHGTCSMLVTCTVFGWMVDMTEYAFPHAWAWTVHDLPQGGWMVQVREMDGVDVREPAQ